MLTVQQNLGNINFEGAVGKGPTRLTSFGVSIDVVRLDGQDRIWGDLVPTNQNILSELARGTCIKVSSARILRGGSRPLWAGYVSIVVR